MAFTRRTEVRHISQAELIKIAEMLNVPSSSPAWKKVMQIVPAELIHHEQLSDCKPKYNIQNIRSIEKAGGRLKNSAYIFLEEWMTSGKIRPTLSHLLQLLVKSELWRAAEYVAINLLSEAPPQRPAKGPAAKIDISLPDDLGGVDNELLNGNYPNTSEIMDLNRCHEAASKNIASKQIFDRSLMPDRPISEQDLIRMATAPQLSQDVTATPVQTTNDLTRRPEHQDSHMSPSSQHRTNATNSSASANKSASSAITKNESVDRISVQTSASPHNFVPNFQYFNGGSNSSDNSNTSELPNLSILNFAHGTDRTNSQRESIDRNVAHISQITDQSRSTSSSVMSNDDEENSTGNVPHLSELMQQPNNLTDCSTSAISSVPTSHNFVPNFQFFKGGTDYYDNSQSDTSAIPNLSAFNVANGTVSTNEQPECADRNVPYLSQTADRSQSTSDSAIPRVYSNDEGENSTGNVPHLSELMEQLNNQTNYSTSAVNPVERISSVPTSPNLQNFLLFNNRTSDSNNLPTCRRTDVNITNVSILNIPNVNNNDLNTTEQQESFVGNVPHLSQLLSQSQSLDNRGEVRNSTDHHESLNANIPQFSQLLSESYPTSDNLPPEQNSNDTQECLDGNVPHLSQLLSQSHLTSENLPQELNSTDEGESFEGNVPHLSQLLVNQSTDGSGA